MSALFFTVPEIATAEELAREAAKNRTYAFPTISIVGKKGETEYRLTVTPLRVQEENGKVVQLDGRLIEIYPRIPGTSCQSPVGRIVAFCFRRGKDGAPSHAGRAAAIGAW